MAYSGSGSGTALDPYLITSWSQMAEMRDDLSAHYKLTTDLDADSTGYVGIGDTWEDYFPGTGTIKTGTAFQGSFDGDGHTVSDIVAKDSSVPYMGFIGFWVGDYVKNIIIKNAEILGSTQCGLVGSHRDKGDITNCAVVGGSITANDHRAGGIVGWQQVETGKVENCYNDGCSISVNGSTGEAGGIIGQSRTGCQKCWSNAKVSASDHEGGIVGWDHDQGSTILDCFWDWQVSDVKTSLDGAGKLTTEMKSIGTYNQTYTETHSGVVSVTGFVVTLTSGDNFDTNWQEDDVINLNEISHVIESVDSTTQITLKTEPIEGTGIDYSKGTGSYGLTTAWDMVSKGDYDDEIWFIDDGNDYPRLGFEYVAAGILYHKASGAFGLKPIKYKASGSFAQKTLKVKDGGVWK